MRRGDGRTCCAIKPWIFRETRDGYWDISAEHRVMQYRRYCAFARAHWGEDEHGLSRVRQFVKWHLDFWCRYAPRDEQGVYPSMQRRDSANISRSPLEALLARDDEQAFEYLTECLVTSREIVPGDAPAAIAAARRSRRDEAVEVEG